MMMSLEDAQHQSAQLLGTTTALESLKRLSAQVQTTLHALEADQWLSAQQTLEDCLPLLLSAFDRLGLDPDRAFARSVARYSQAEKAFYLYPDRVEIRVGNELKGGWELANPEEWWSARAMAAELNCPVFILEGRQLDLFQS
jgi:hypothetical protein